MHPTHQAPIPESTIEWIEDLPAAETALASLCDPVRAWFAATFAGPTPAQRLAVGPIAAGENVLLASPTGTGKTLAAFLATLDRLVRRAAAGQLDDRLACVYISPLRALGYDVEKNLLLPLKGLANSVAAAQEIRVGVRTGDTSAYHRRKLREQPPQILITTPESLSLMLSQSAHTPGWAGVEQIVVDEIHALAGTKRGADLALSLERLTYLAGRELARVGLSATCSPLVEVARFLVGGGRRCRIADVGRLGVGPRPPELRIETLCRAGDPPSGRAGYRRLLNCLVRWVGKERTTLVFANTRALAERLTFDLRHHLAEGAERVAAHHSALGAQVRRRIEERLKRGELQAVVTSTSLELGIDIGSIDLVVLVNPPSGTARLLQRVGRSGHGVGRTARGILMAAHPAELAECVVSAEAARAVELEPIRCVRGPLDVLCQQMVGMAAERAWPPETAWELVRRAGPMADLSRADFDASLDSLLDRHERDPPALGRKNAAEAGAASDRSLGGKLRRDEQGRFVIRNGRTARWLMQNIGTIISEELVRVCLEDEPNSRSAELGTVEEAFVERLLPGDCFLLNGRVLEYCRSAGMTAYVKLSSGEPTVPRWSSAALAMPAELAARIERLRGRVKEALLEGDLAVWELLRGGYGLDERATEVLRRFFQAQEIQSEIPSPGVLLVEEVREASAEVLGARGPGTDEAAANHYYFHAAVGRARCEVLGRAVAGRLDRRWGRNVRLAVTDLGWRLSVPAACCLTQEDLPELLAASGLDVDLFRALERGELLRRRFRHVAAIGLMVLRNRDGRRQKVGGMQWAGTRLYDLLRRSHPEHPLLRETEREVSQDLFDLEGARETLERLTPALIRFRSLREPSPFALGWIERGGSAEPIQFESPESALKRLHARLMGPRLET